MVFSSYSWKRKKQSIMIDLSALFSISHNGLNVIELLFYFQINKFSDDLWYLAMCRNIECHVYFLGKCKKVSEYKTFICFFDFQTIISASLNEHIHQIIITCDSLHIYSIHSTQLSISVTWTQVHLLFLSYWFRWSVCMKTKYQCCFPYYYFQVFTWL